MVEECFSESTCTSTVGRFGKSATKKESNKEKAAIVGLSLPEATRC